jgi:hypothetical protein
VTELDERAKTNEAELGQHLALARWLLAHESGDRQGVEEMVGAAEAACAKLRRHLARRIGPAGFESLLARAVHLSKRRFPFLKGVEPEQQDGGCLGRVRESAMGRDPAEVDEGLATLFANLLWLLGRFVGDDMALRQITRLWPEVPILDAGPSPQEKDE